MYDAAGNLVKKGNQYQINKDTVTFTATSGEGVEYWEYTYDLLDRLTGVAKNGTVVADYGYSPEGLREIKRSAGVTTHYVFEGISYDGQGKNNESWDGISFDMYGCILGNYFTHFSC